MRKEQWFIFGIAFLLLGMFFIQKDLAFEKACMSPESYSSIEDMKEWSTEPLERYELWCINTEIYDPFIYLFSVMSIVCFINGGLESLAKKKQ